MQMPEPIKPPELITKLRHDKVNVRRERVDLAGMEIRDSFLDFMVLSENTSMDRREVKESLNQFAIPTLGQSIFSFLQQKKNLYEGFESCSNFQRFVSVLNRLVSRMPLQNELAWARNQIAWTRTQIAWTRTQIAWARTRIARTQISHVGKCW